MIEEGLHGEPYPYQHMDPEWQALYAPWKSQHGQDKYVFQKLGRNGYFVDIGAHDGITLSNTYTLEQHFGWKGICIEPMPHQFKRLQENRSSVNYNCAIYDSEGVEKFIFVDSDGYPDMLSGIQRDFNLKRTNEMFAECKGDVKARLIDVHTRLFNIVMDGCTNIDFLSIDTEGSEIKILKSIDYNMFKFKMIMFENPERVDMTSFFKTKGYVYDTRLGPDDVYKKI